jgi:hypothetical protein
MCTYNITVDERTLASSPNAHTYEEMKSAIRERIDRIEAGEAKFYSHEEVFSKMIIRQEPPAMMDLETVRENLHQMVREVYAQA